LSLEKSAAEVGAVDLGVTIDADFGRKKEISLVSQPMALNADPPHIAVRKQEAVR
jgi:hypothetical protein